MPTDTSSKAIAATGCPCENESAERLSVDSRPERIITLVHGTFARHAPWTREGPLWDQLSDPQSLPGSTVFQRFCWSGDNSHSARLTAGAALAKQLKALAEKFPGARKYIIGHSHGGNVMLYATKDEKVAENVAGMVTMATPFIAVRRRKLPGLVLFAFIAIALGGMFEAFLHFFGTRLTGIPVRPDQASLLVAILVSVWLVGTVISALLYRPAGKAFGLGRLFTLLRRGKDVDAIVDEELQRMKLTPDDEKTLQDRYEKLLVARPIGDEASMSLIVSQFLSWFENRILTLLSSKVKRLFSGIGWFSWIWKILLLLVLFVVATKVALPGSLPWLMQSLDDSLRPLFGDHYFLRGLSTIVIIGAGAVILLFGFLSLIAMIGLLVAGLAFGLDAMFWNHFVSTTAECSPPGAARVYLQSPPPDPSGRAAAGLAHSGIYSDAKVIDEIVEWIKSREQSAAVS